MTSSKSLWRTFGLCSLEGANFNYLGTYIFKTIIYYEFDYLFCYKYLSLDYVEH